MIDRFKNYLSESLINKDKVIDMYVKTIQMDDDVNEDWSSKKLLFIKTESGKEYKIKIIEDEFEE